MYGRTSFHLKQSFSPFEVFVGGIMLSPANGVYISMAAIALWELFASPITGRQIPLVEISTFSGAVVLALFGVITAIAFFYAKFTNSVGASIKQCTGTNANVVPFTGVVMSLGFIVVTFAMPLMFFILEIKLSFGLLIMSIAYVYAFANLVSLYSRLKAFRLPTTNAIHHPGRKPSPFIIAVGAIVVTLACELLLWHLSGRHFNSNGWFLWCFPAIQVCAGIAALLGAYRSNVTQQTTLGEPSRLTE